MLVIPLHRQDNGSQRGKVARRENWQSPVPPLFLAPLFFPWVPLMGALFSRSLGRTRVPRHLVHCLGLQPQPIFPMKYWGGEWELVHWWGWFRMREGKEEVLTEARFSPSTVHQKGLRWPQPFPLFSNKHVLAPYRASASWTRPTHLTGAWLPSTSYC